MPAAAAWTALACRAGWNRPTGPVTLTRNGKVVLVEDWRSNTGDADRGLLVLERVSALDDVVELAAQHHAVHDRAW